jgi:hypothetical protein
MALCPPAGADPATSNPERRVLTTLSLAAVVLAADTAMPAPHPAHAWLKKFEGKWAFTGECALAPGRPPMTMTGTETVKAIGPFWVVGELTADGGVPMTGVTTVGYDPAKRKYVGTWVGSMCDWLCRYEGEADGDTLTLHCEGPSPLDPTKTTKMKDVTEFKPDGTRVLTSLVLGPDGQWTKFMTLTARRVK